MERRALPDRVQGLRKRLSNPSWLMGIQEYLELLDASGRMLQAGKAGAVPALLAGILERLGLRPSVWSTVVTEYKALFGRMVGPRSALMRRARDASRQWHRGISTCGAAFT